MTRHTEHDTREHILAVGEELCIQRGFTGMGLSELLKTAGVPKGSFYHYFRSKEAFGVAMLHRHYAGYQHTIHQHFFPSQGTARARLLAWYQQLIEQFCQHGTIGGCLTVKLSAEVCDLSEAMRTEMHTGVSMVISLLAQVLEQGRKENSLVFKGDAQIQAQVLYSLWLGANLQTKMSRNTLPLESALAHVKTIIAAPE
ncbi:TetR family transcriptional regulator [Superficieibacter electus]|uniref:TetR family transcriptional regulator n=1 Tax=Superficieibacter electus TaxID=2022662 RepID=A0A2P5GU23_9ENTR|nr:TetR/AcrR family transcriptional regulator [Superficieibacter electus]POP47200.1 TetR family transcriptional regulator [Superficieibacter electus]POP50046.1 TetR family transcriptional regulator [Superficieibacter electus]